MSDNQVNKSLGGAKSTGAFYITRKVKTDKNNSNTILEKVKRNVGNFLGIGHAVVGVIDPNTGNIRFSEYGKDPKYNRSRLFLKNKNIKAKFKDLNNPTQEEIEKLFLQYSPGDNHTTEYNIKYVPGVNYDKIIKYLNDNENGTGDFVLEKYNVGSHNCGHYAASAINNNLIDEDLDNRSIIRKTVDNAMGIPVVLNIMGLINNPNIENLKKLGKSFIPILNYDDNDYYLSNPSPVHMQLPKNAKEYNIKLNKK